ncbi:TlpA family protein disulfide reductase [Pseudomonas sp. Marseille-QA0892]
MLKRMATSSLACVFLLLSGCSDDGEPGKQSAVTDAQGGSWSVVNYWAEWCGPCRTEVPELNALNDRLKATGDRVVGINFDELEGEALARSAQVLGITFPLMEGDDVARLGLPRPQVLPTTYLVDSTGDVRKALVGEQTADGLAAELDALKRKN